MLGQRCLMNLLLCLPDITSSGLVPSYRQAQIYSGYYVSPLYTKVETCCFTCVRSVLSVSLCLWVSHSFRSNTFYGEGGQTPDAYPNAGLMLAHLRRLWVNSSPALAYRVVPGATLNMGSVTVNPALVQSIVLVPPACWYRQHEVLTRAEWILASTGDAGPTFNRHWFGVGLYTLMHWISIGSLSRVCWKPYYVSGAVPKRNNKFHLIYSVCCPQEPFNYINYKSHWHYIYYLTTFKVMLLEGNISRPF